MLRMFTIYDTKAQGFNTPFFEKTTAAGERVFSRMANDPQTVIFHHPSDFILFELGDFDQEKGYVDPLPQPRNLGPASNFVNLGPTPVQEPFRTEAAPNGAKSEAS